MKRKPKTPQEPKRLSYLEARQKLTHAAILYGIARENDGRPANIKAKLDDLAAAALIYRSAISESVKMEPKS